MTNPKQMFWLCGILDGCTNYFFDKQVKECESKDIDWTKHENTRGTALPLLEFVCEKTIREKDYLVHLSIYRCTLCDQLRLYKQFEFPLHLTLKLLFSHFRTKADRESCQLQDLRNRFFRGEITYEEFDTLEKAGAKDLYDNNCIDWIGQELHNIRNLEESISATFALELTCGGIYYKNQYQWIKQQYLLRELYYKRSEEKNRVLKALVETAINGYSKWTDLVVAASRFRSEIIGTPRFQILRVLIKYWRAFFYKNEEGFIVPTRWARNEFLLPGGV